MYNFDNPRSWDNLGKMVCFHGRYDLGDDHNYNHNDYNGWEEMKNAIIKENDVCVILPLYLYDHSGITMNTTGFSCPWDSGQVGWTFVSKKKVREEYGVKRISQELIEKVTEVLVGEVKTFDMYLTGELYEEEYEQVWFGLRKEPSQKCGGFFILGCFAQPGPDVILFGGTKYCD